MKKLIFPKNYVSILDVTETQKAIKLVKDTFQAKLSKNLGLSRVTAPLFVDPSTGLNDNLSGKEKPVSFETSDGSLEIIQSLAKWKRFALNKYSFSGLYTDMNAIRPCEETDNIHSLYVDQWDWEKVIKNTDRKIVYLKKIVDSIYDAFLKTYKKVVSVYPNLKTSLSKHVTYITSQKLLDMYPNKSPKEREYLATKKYGTIFIIGIGKKLSDGSIHDTRAADYDDWNMNGDLILYYDVLDIAFELSSMGIRVNKDSLIYQLKEKNELYKKKLQYHKEVINDVLPLTIGGGIGQSRLCMFLLKKAHIGEVQSSHWTKKDIKILKEHNIDLL